MTSSNKPKIVINSGEPAGIGPDIVVQLSQHGFDADWVVIGDPEMLKMRAQQLGLNLNIALYSEKENKVPNVIQVIPLQVNNKVIPGKLDQANSDYVIEGINTAVDLCHSGEFQAMVTAPVQKSIINDAGIEFSGHTEWIAHRTGSNKPVMMLANDIMRVCLATTHLPLSEVAENITEQNLSEVLDVMLADLNRLYGIDTPTIAVCGLNPHAGEGGHLGKEEILTISPVVQKYQKQGFKVIGPIPADTAFTKEQLPRFDAVLSMFHDQGLPVIKHSGFGEVVNVTLGLPIIRTSVDHGTALDIAGSGRAQATSLISAVNLAIDFANNAC